MVNDLRYLPGGLDYDPMRQGCVCRGLPPPDSIWTVSGPRNARQGLCRLQRLLALRQREHHQGHRLLSLETTAATVGGGGTAAPEPMRCMQRPGTKEDQGHRRGFDGKCHGGDVAKANQMTGLYNVTQRSSTRSSTRDSFPCPSQPHPLPAWRLSQRQVCQLV